jgi:ABC-type iron transport system FetAB ATPase subunit
MLNSLKIVNLQTLSGPAFSFSVEPKKLLCLTGISGSGKSLLLRAIVDLDPYKGEVWFNGQISTEVPPPLWRKKIGLLQPTSHWWGDRVVDHFIEPESAHQFMAPLDLPIEALEWQVHRMSTGEKQRMSIVRLLSNNPSALLLDEPTANLDPKTTLKVESLIFHFMEENCVPVLWVSHDLEQVERIAHTHLMVEAETTTERTL